MILWTLSWWVGAPIFNSNFLQSFAHCCKMLLCVSNAFNWRSMRSLGFWPVSTESNVWRIGPAREHCNWSDLIGCVSGHEWALLILLLPGFGRLHLLVKFWTLWASEIIFYAGWLAEPINSHCCCHCDTGHEDCLLLLHITVCIHYGPWEAFQLQYSPACVACIANAHESSWKSIGHNRDKIADIESVSEYPA